MQNTFSVNCLLFRPLPGLFTRTANRTLSFQLIDLSRKFFTHFKVDSEFHEKQTYHFLFTKTDIVHSE